MGYLTKVSNLKVFKISILALGIILPILSVYFFRNRRKEIALLIFSSIFSILIVEAFLRQFYPQVMDHDRMFEYDPDLGWKFISNNRGSIVYAEEASHWIETNSLGFRDNSPHPEMDNQKKILVLGDSFVSNISVRDNEVFTERIERQLTNTTVLNFGVNGYGQVQEYLLLKQWLEIIDPDLVILVIYIRNDFNDNVGGYSPPPRPVASWDKDGASLKIHPPPPFQQRMESTSDSFLKIYKRSHFCAFLNRRFNILIGRRFHEDGSEQIPSPYVAPELYLCHTQPSQQTQLMYRTMEALLMKIADYVDEHEIPLVFALAPSIIQVEDQLWQSVILSNADEPKNYVRSLPNDELLRFAVRNELLMMDLLPILHSNSNIGNQCYNSEEQHWNAEGNDVVTHALIDYLDGKELLQHMR